LPPNTIIVDRTSRYGNPYQVRRRGDVVEVWDRRAPGGPRLERAFGGPAAEREARELAVAGFERELAAVRPAVAVALGTTAARSLLGRPVTIAKTRGQVLQDNDPPVVVTIHPSAILRAEGADRRAMTVGLRDDLRLAVEHATRRSTETRGTT
jgi:uracil-DNA glycosylase